MAWHSSATAARAVLSEMAFAASRPFRASSTTVWLLSSSCHAWPDFCRTATPAGTQDGDDTGKGVSHVRMRIGSQRLQLRGSGRTMSKVEPCSDGRCNNMCRVAPHMRQSRRNRFMQLQRASGAHSRARTSMRVAHAAVLLARRLNVARKSGQNGCGAGHHLNVAAAQHGQQAGELLAGRQVLPVCGLAHHQGAEHLGSKLLDLRAVGNKGSKACVQCVWMRLSM